MDDAQIMGNEYFENMLEDLDCIPSATWDNIQISKSAARKRIIKSAKLWIGWIRSDANAKELTKKSYLRLLLEFVRLKFITRPGYSGNPNTDVTSRYNWAKDLVLFMAIHLHDHTKLRDKNMRKYFRKMLPNWQRHSTFIGKQAPLYRSKETKYWSGEDLLMHGYDELFPNSILNQIVNWFQMNINQRAWFVDWVEYDLLLRQCEAVRTSSKPSGKGMGLYWKDLDEKIYRDDISFGNRSICALKGFLDRQKNETNSSKFHSINNKFVASLDDDIPEEWLNPSNTRLYNRRFCTRRKLWSVLIGYNIKASDVKLTFPLSGLAPVFPEVPIDFRPGDAPPMYNMRKYTVDKCRRLLYAKYIPDWALSSLSGHCWRGGKQYHYIVVYEHVDHRIRHDLQNEFYHQKHQLLTKHNYLFSFE